MIRLAQRVEQIEPFWVMECAKAADEIARSPACDPALGGERMLYLNIGEPDFGAPDAVNQAAQACIASRRTQYTHAAGLPALRAAIASWYATREGLHIDPARIVVTAGASAALQLLCTALIDPGDEVLMPDPSYPCNRHFVTATGGSARLLPSGAAQRFQLDAAAVDAAWGPRTRAVMLASPSNPTGTSIAPDALRELVHTVRARGGLTIVDEIYLGLSYGDEPARSAAGLGEDVICVGSFSKYFGMTGWRLGWLVLPPELVPAVEKLAQNLYICASSIAQHAALACFEPATLALCEQRVAELRRRRDYIVPSLRALGLDVPVMPDGAFYVWADIGRHTGSGPGGSWDFCFDMMRRAHVALTPGRDFGRADTGRHARLSFACSMDTLEAAVGRLGRELSR
ncbi:MAG: hypothetical protein RLZZ584_1996 [Pseudomonadota bacterium]|jgi:aspartate/methionine/tyrosine aminotransferase